MMLLLKRLYRYFNPRPPWGGRLHHIDRRVPAIIISIHALRGEGDYVRFIISFSTVISIHALRGEGDVIDND